MTLNEVLLAYQDFNLNCDIGTVVTFCSTDEVSDWAYYLSIEGDDHQHLDLVTAEVTQTGNVDPPSAKLYLDSMAKVTYPGSNASAANDWIARAWQSATDDPPAETDLGAAHLNLYVTEANGFGDYTLELRAPEIP